MIVTYGSMSEKGQLLQVPLEIFPENLEQRTASLEEFICEIVRKLVQDHNHRKKDAPQLFIDISSTNASRGTFKLPFMQNHRQIDVQTAQETASLAYKDGLYLIFQNKLKLGNLDQNITIQNNDVFHFIKLTFLTASHGFHTADI